MGEKIETGKTSTMEKKRADVDGIDTSVLPARKILSFRTAGEDETHQFVGYDLGRLRVQVTNRRKTFLSADDTLVRVECEDWLHGQKDLRITVNLRGHSLRLSRSIGCQSTNPFHLTTENGIILAFSRTDNTPDTSQSSFGSYRDLEFDFRASWPSGLLIEPVIGEDKDNPFYIRQSYISKGSEFSDVAHEVCRKFLRNGTVLKYMDDDSVIVLRPNGVIVTCLAFERHDEGFLDQLSLISERIRKGGSRQSVTSKQRRKLIGYPKSHQSSLMEASYTPKRVSEEQLIVKFRSVRKNDLHDPLVNISRNRASDLSTIETPAAVKVLRYTVLNHDGRRYEVFNDLLVREHDRLLVRQATDYEVNEIFTRRADGTTMLLNSNDELTVTYTDGTRITTGYAIEDQLVTCDWSEEELRRYFDFGKTKGRDRGRKKDVGQDIADTNAEDNETAGLLIADGFVSVLLTCRAEHKNYASVSYDQSAVNCTLSMPGDLRVSISRRGHYEVSMADGVNLKIGKESLTFSNDVRGDCDGKSISTYEFLTTVGIPRTIFTSVDVFGNVFEVKNDGSSRYRGGRSPETGNEEKEVLERDKGSRVEDKGKFRGREAARPRRSRYRIFAVNRDLTAYEYLHRSIVRDVFAGHTSVIRYPISRRPELRRLITFVPLEPESRSKELLQPYTISEVKPTNYNRKDLLRSTYSIPYDWLLPFGKNGNGVYENTHDLPLLRNVQRPLPKLLRVRILYGFKAENRNAITDLQKGLERYRISILCDSSKYKLRRLTEEENEKYGYEDNLENNLRDISLGIKTSIDVKTYTDALQSELLKLPKDTPREATGLIRLRAEKKLMKEELEWYRQCIRRKVILPYFQNIAGTCYQWVTHCIQEATKT